MPRAHSRGRSLPGRITATLPPDPASPTLARHVVRQVAHITLSDEDRDLAELLTSELVTNAIVHANTVCDIELSFPEDDVLRVAVTDYAAGAPAVHSGDPLDAKGRGLVLVSSLAHKWGVVPTDPYGKTVWFELHV